MKKFHGIAASISLVGVLFAASAYSAIAEREIIRYYDEYGRQVGYDHHGCNSQRFVWGIQTDNFTIENFSCGNPVWHDPSPPPNSCGGPGELSC